MYICNDFFNKTLTFNMSDNKNNNNTNALEKLNKIMHPLMCRYKNDIDYVDKLISIYSIINMDKDNILRKFEKDVLNYYVRFGYSTETKKKIEAQLNKSPATITQATFFLKNKGYLVNSSRNHSTKKLSKELQLLKDTFINGNKKILSVGFIRKNG